ncbi:hypothetical protein FEM48_Zijuj11G0073200 [Ziziphus jujuba var. spinosa]|uniref:Uncharacterized protein n=1 Tax=Ziziphus jujuba var. spinosa TaxID=714518 RepID=A0A978UHL2_ZIZJJ|nr:hypothetical protein FEM48_Zijuj11G0073200 [Ziziphus jujuba var. spinosa]
MQAPQLDLKADEKSTNRLSQLRDEEKGESTQTKVRSDDDIEGPKVSNIATKDDPITIEHVDNQARLSPSSAPNMIETQQVLVADTIEKQLKFERGREFCLSYTSNLPSRFEDEKHNQAHPKTPITYSNLDLLGEGLGHPSSFSITLKPKGKRKREYLNPAHAARRRKGENALVFKEPVQRTVSPSSFLMANIAHSSPTRLPPPPPPCGLIYLVKLVLAQLKYLPCKNSRV